ncbi:sugar transferase (PEP-CTERM/EpsH1 system associated) [Novosphingobium sp. 1529]|uniref:TIGR03087 family PEP-CTERM/XrtA system glycosyltransferase n=1 Tax=Novosphingobium sp. 1529 TaxID=3156424 RepID=UPI00339A265C
MAEAAAARGQPDRAADRARAGLTGMGEILFLAHRIPFPPDRGDKIRSHHILKALAALAPVHVACLADNAQDMAHEAELAAVAASHCLVRRRGSLIGAGLSALLSGRPISLAAFASTRLARYVKQVLATRPISTIFVFSGQMAQYVPASFQGRVVMDFVDVDSAKFGQYGRRPGLGAPVYLREAWLLRRYEARIARRATTSLLVSEAEADLLRSRLGQGPIPDVRALGNGIDTALFDPAGIPMAPELVMGGPQIVFTGQMDYPPNVEAVVTFARQVMPLIKGRFPGAQFNVVGRAPTAPVLALDGVNGTRVTGAVPDVRPWLAGADLVVVPLSLARGVQNKVLEAMAMARPVLLTPQAATGIAAVDGRDFAISPADPEELAARAVGLLTDTIRADALGRAARAFVIAQCGWDRVLAPLPGLVGLDRRFGRRAA